MYWFAHEYIDFRNGKIVSKYTPQDKRFGFHKFENDDDDQLLPSQSLPYYEVGNLNAPGADKLPNYVRANYSHSNLDSNMDRIIVCQDTNGSFNRVYVTEHLKHDVKLFDRSRTYRVSQSLLQTIKNIRSLEQFLKQTSNTQEGHACPPQLSDTEEEDVKTSREEIYDAIALNDNSCSCTIL